MQMIYYYRCVSIKILSRLRYFSFARIDFPLIFLSFDKAIKQNHVYNVFHDFQIYVSSRIVFEEFSS